MKVYSISLGNYFNILNAFKCTMFSMMRSKKNSLLIFSVMAIILFIIPSVQANDLYADLQITVDNAGFVNIEGNTNYANLIVKESQNFTSKTKEIWRLNITTDVTFSDYIYSITLPEHAQIKSISSSGSTLIGESTGNLIINGYGNNESLTLVVEYQTDKISETNAIFGLDLLSIFLVSCIIVLIICFLIVLFYVDKRENSLFSHKKEFTPQLELKGLNDRQKKIMNLLYESDITLTQTDIQRELNMPKASVSRNIRRLELKGLIEKEQIGISNIIRLKKQ